MYVAQYILTITFLAIFYVQWIVYKFESLAGASLGG